jgi:glutathione S-transferase
MPKITLVALTITLLALLQFFFFLQLVGMARGRYGIKAPAVTGNEIFERYFRVQMNTMEQLIVFLPALWIASLYPLVAYYWIALIGAVYLIGRFIYQRSYVADPDKRSLGFALSALPIVALLIIDLIELVMLWVRTP